MSYSMGAFETAGPFIGRFTDNCRFCSWDTVALPLPVCIVLISQAAPTNLSPVGHYGGGYHIDDVSEAHQILFRKV